MSIKFLGHEKLEKMEGAVTAAGLVGTGRMAVGIGKKVKTLCRREVKLKDSLNEDCCHGNRRGKFVSLRLVVHLNKK